MEEYILDGETYYYKNGKWLDENKCRAPLAVVSRLNALLIKKEDFEQYSMQELLEIIDKARSSDNVQLASQALEAALRIASVSEIKQLLPRLTSNYRRIGKPQSAIDVFKTYTDEYQKSVWSSALFTSVAAAYCDICDYETAKKCADRAMSISAGESSPELISVYKRIKEA